ncbi:hypothetical protein D3C81_1373100 [compost metagenome]
MRALDDVAAVVEVLEVDVLLAAAMENDFLLVGRQLAEWYFQAEVIVRGQRAEHLEVIDVTPVPAAYRTFGQSKFTVDQALGIEELLDPQPITSRTGASRVVEGEQLGLQLADGMAADRAGEACGENHFFERFVVHRGDQGDAIGQLQRSLERLGQTLLEIFTDLETVDHNVDGVLLLFIQLGQLIKFVQLAVDSCTNKTLGAKFIKHRQVLTLALANHRRQQHQFAAFRLGQYQVNHLTDGLSLQRDVVIRAARRTDAGVEQAQVVVDLGDSPDSRTRVMRGRFLFDGNGWRQTFDGVDVRLFHHRQELPGVGR